ncbi:MAG: glycosyltransferase family 4 protein [Anaerolineae bacterium]|nr:glycosyltransferase family 4 protein [Anaerolineae bacterium]
MHIGLLTCELTHTHGWAHYSASLVEALHRAGVKITVIAARNSPPLLGLNIHPILPDTLLPERWIMPKLALLTPQVRRLLADCDVIHTTIEPYAPLAVWAAGQHPTFVTGHGSYMQLATQRSWPINTIFGRAFLRSKIVCVSHYTERVTRNLLPEANIVIVNNGVDTARFESILPHQANGEPVVLSVGAVKPRKGTLELVQAIAVVRQQIPNVQCIIIGNTTYDPEYVGLVKKAVANLDLAQNVHLLGQVVSETLMDWYSKATLFALPSMNEGWKFEGYGLVHLEASAAGLPVIGTTDCGAEDAIDDGITGLLIPQYQVAEKLPQAIIRLLTDRELAAQMGKAGQVKAKRQTWDHVAGQMIELYQSALA